MKRATKAKFLRLKTLCQQAVANIYERIMLAREVMADTDWIAETHDGDMEKAFEAVGHEYFPDLHGYVPLAKLVAIGDTFPAENDWREYRYDVRAMEALYDERREAERSTEPKPAKKRATLKELEERDDIIKSLEYQLKQAKAEIERLQVRAGELSETNAVLRGRIEALETVMQRSAD